MMPTSKQKKASEFHTTDRGTTARLIPRQSAWDVSLEWKTVFGTGERTCLSIGNARRLHRVLGLALDAYDNRNDL